MPYYTVPAVTVTTPDGSKVTKPDIPDGIEWVSAINGVVGNTYIILTTVDLPPKTGRTLRLPRTALEAAANALGLTFDNVDKLWLRGKGG